MSIAKIAKDILDKRIEEIEARSAAKRIAMLAFMGRNPMTLAFCESLKASGPISIRWYKDAQAEYGTPSPAGVVPSDTRLYEKSRTSGRKPGTDRPRIPRPRR